MKVILVIGSFLLPLIMFYVQNRFILFKIIFNLLAIVSVLIFGNISALSIYKIIKDNKVFMNDIHAIFLNSFFPISGSYLGIYILYRLLLLNLQERRMQ